MFIDYLMKSAPKKRKALVLWFYHPV